ncbi:hypothetical protein DM02DRAFT_42965 [Periconia macrospinosa]|uniref:Uncharacterized protein n=1 Tax=Periconia macrospinosa TaxID=97972 RepID=A0A2V1DMV7_9PLEO|nr:hypothetical protein DM02DRAFT_42965 [Periconia macrospinosa]
MEYEKCYIYAPPEPSSEERPLKRPRTSKSHSQPQLPERLSAYRRIWTQQEKRIQQTLEDADSVTQEKIVRFIGASTPSEKEPQTPIPTGLVVAGPSIASHGSFFSRLGQSIKSETNSAYTVLTSGECPNLKTLLKCLVKKITSRTDDGDEDGDLHHSGVSARKGPRLLDFDLGHVQQWQNKNKTQHIVIAIQDTEAFDTAVLVELVDIIYSWLDRLPFVLLFGIATSAENFEDRMSGRSLRYLDGQKFDVTQSDVIIEKLFGATLASTDVPLRIGPTLSHRLLDRQKDHVQNVQDFIDGLKYAYMSHFYANCPSIFLDEGLLFNDVSSESFEALRNLPSFRRWIETMLENGNASDVRILLESDQSLYEKIVEHVGLGQAAMASLSQAASLFHVVRENLQLSPPVRLSTIWTRAAAGDIIGSPLFRETMLSVKKTSSDRLVPLLLFLKELDVEGSPIDWDRFYQNLDKLVQEHAGSGPLRSQDDVRNDSVRTTVIAQKVLLSKHKATLSAQDKAYSDLVARLFDELDKYFTSAFIDPRALFLSEVLMYDLKSPHTEVFQPKPRFAIERALASPHDYLGCSCCDRSQGEGEAILAATQPATAILYQLFLESGVLINASDLWSAFEAIIGEDNQEDESRTSALIQRALAELRYLGLVKPSRKNTDHVGKIMWKGL